MANVHRGLPKLVCARYMTGVHTYAGVQSACLRHYGICLYTQDYNNIINIVYYNYTCLANLPITITMNHFCIKPLRKQILYSNWPTTLDIICIGYMHYSFHLCIVCLILPVHIAEYMEFLSDPDWTNHMWCTWLHLLKYKLVILFRSWLIITMKTYICL